MSQKTQYLTMNYGWESFWLKNRKLTFYFNWNHVLQNWNKRKHTHSFWNVISLWLQQQTSHTFSAAVMNNQSTHFVHAHILCSFGLKHTRKLLIVKFTALCKAAHSLSELSLSCTWMRNSTAQVVLNRRVTMETNPHLLLCLERERKGGSERVRAGRWTFDACVDILELRIIFEHFVKQSSQQISMGRLSRLFFWHLCFVAEAIMNAGKTYTAPHTEKKGRIQRQGWERKRLKCQTKPLEILQYCVYLLF